ncbi:serine hydrolase domain-containing protein [Alkalihalobacillus sp. LMS39]|uniref:serine hydrolase domain-containing protein n=1 Tax=Alkalihalobacillus sp. LMS39 TaxID=2924032 RepID=UPI001FB555DD|nr:serine hydrolase domain-containing protein [Alkalihalobacillus sp. LMS39]UOE95017.1 beta-lactamase family protein [Alkalihalobacillus sp. LMS39]
MLKTEQKNKITAIIEKSFRTEVQKNENIKSACLLVHSDTHNIHLNVNEGLEGNDQPVYMASVGKIFTSVITSILFEKEQLSFEDPLTDYIDDAVVHDLHLYKGTNYTNQNKIKHLLNHTSGLSDNFWPLLENLLEDPTFKMSPEDAITWTKQHTTPQAPPGTTFHYTDTNYHLLGLVIEKITKLPFHEVLNQYIFKPLSMQKSFMLHYSQPLDENTKKVAPFYYKNINLANYEGYGGIDYAGGGVVSTGEDLLIFMKALTSHQLLKKETLETMMNDKVKYGFGIDYGYGIMQFKPVPLLMPKKFSVWGHAGATGAYMFYHPQMNAYVIGTFNDFSYERKGVRFMLMKVINELAKA